MQLLAELTVLTLATLQAASALMSVYVARHAAAALRLICMCHSSTVACRHHHVA